MTYKFRAWDKRKMYTVDTASFSKNGKMVFMFEHKGEKCHLLSESAITMQFTGLSDKVGKEIYEGDIVKYYYHDNTGVQENIGVIEFRSAEFMIKRNDENSYGHIEYDDTEVIGNIHEHKNLLNNKEGA